MKAVKTGKHLGVSQPIMPPMPWQAYSRLSPADLRAVFAFLTSIPAIKNNVPDYPPPAEAAKSAAVK